MARELCDRSDTGVDSAIRKQHECTSVFVADILVPDCRRACFPMLMKMMTMNRSSGIGKWLKLRWRPLVKEAE